MKKRPLIVIAGPTGVGKSHIAVRLAKEIDGMIISADSMQVYKGMDIGSAKIRPEEMEGIPHALIDICEPGDSFHVVEYQKLAKEAIDEAYEKGMVPILTGGTGFYIQAVTRDIDFTESDENEALRESLAKLDTDTLYARLLACDPQTDIHPNNRKRVIRALEYFEQTGEPISKHNEEERQKESPYELVFFVLTDEREKIYRKIEERVDRMMEEGLLEEVRSLKETGCTNDLVSMQGLGYKQLFDYLDGTASLEDAVARIKLETRHYAKRQLTWFKREKEAIWLDKQIYLTEDEMLEEMIDAINRREI